MTEAPSHLIALPGGRVRVLRLFAGRAAYALRYDVYPGEAMCHKCGCTTIFGCVGGCAWITPTHDLCTRCYQKGMVSHA